MREQEKRHSHTDRQVKLSMAMMIARAERLSVSEETQA